MISTGIRIKERNKPHVDFYQRNNAYIVNTCDHGHNSGEQKKAGLRGVILVHSTIVNLNHAGAIAHIPDWLFGFCAIHRTASQVHT